MSAFAPVTDILEWKTPPTVKRGRGNTQDSRPRFDWVAIFEKLRERPNEWALVGRDVSSGGAFLASQKAIGIEVTARGRDFATGRFAEVYARYTPPEEVAA